MLLNLSIVDPRAPIKMDFDPMNLPIKLLPHRRTPIKMTLDPRVLIKVDSDKGSSRDEDEDEHDD